MRRRSFRTSRSGRRASYRLELAAAVITFVVLASMVIERLWLGELPSTLSSGGLGYEVQTAEVLADRLDRLEAAVVDAHEKIDQTQAAANPP